MTRTLTRFAFLPVRLTDGALVWLSSYEETCTLFFGAWYLMERRRA